MAIWEYAPGNQVVFNGYQYTVKGLTKPPYYSASNTTYSNDLWSRQYYYRCSHCFRVELYFEPDKKIDKCKYCNQDRTLFGHNNYSYISPNGFRSDGNGVRVTEFNRFKQNNRFALPGEFPKADDWVISHNFSYYYDTEFIVTLMKELIKEVMIFVRDVEKQSLQIEIITVIDHH